MGLPLGGFLAHPERRFPIFRTPFWYKYPFSFPCFFTAGLALCSVILGYFTIKEVNHPECCLDTYPNEYMQTLVRRETRSPGTEDKQTPSLKQVLTRPVTSIVASNFILATISEMLFNMYVNFDYAHHAGRQGSNRYPIFAFTPVASGGLGLSEATIGIHLGIRAFLMIFTMAFYPRIERRLGTVLFYQLIMSAFPFVILCFPLLNAAVLYSGFAVAYNILLLLSFVTWSWCGFSWGELQMVLAYNSEI